MSNDIKVGDVCEVVASPDGIPTLLGQDVEVIGPEKNYSQDIGGVITLYCFGFMVQSAAGKRYAIARECLRKKPPKTDDQGEPRTDHTPADPEFIQDLQRRLSKTRETA